MPERQPSTGHKSLSQAVDACHPEDFDGHTNWHALNLEQKLLWMSRAARLYLSLHPDHLADRGKAAFPLRR